jgi:phenylacetate-CoA ligase
LADFRWMGRLLTGADMSAAGQFTREGWNWDRERLQAWQLGRLQQLLDSVLPENLFYREKFGTEKLKLDSLDDWSNLPMTTKAELVDSADPLGIGRHHTWGIDRYQRFHRTSGTTDRPLVILDTAADWAWWLSSWQHVLEAAEVGPDDRVLMAFSFGPFIGFWSGHEAILQRGSLVIPAGGLSSLARLDLIRQAQVTVVCCTPSYALHLSELADTEGVDLSTGSVRRLIVAGEPGGSLPAVRDHLEERFGARVIDHAGATEIGPWGMGTAEGNGLHVIETEFIAEFLPLDDETVVGRFEGSGSGELYELVLTALGRTGAPVLRYRTGDCVCPHWQSPDPNAGLAGCGFVRLVGGVLGRSDDMLTIRGMNIFPSSIDAVLRGFDSMLEYRVYVERPVAMDQLRIEVEDRLEQPERIAECLHRRLGLRIDVVCVPLGSLPRFEAKARRWVDLRPRVAGRDGARQ